MRRTLIVLLIGLMAVFMASCGQTYELQSITITPGTYTSSGVSSVNLEGQGAFQQLTVTAHYSNGKTAIVTTQSKFALTASPDPLAPLSSVTIDSAGIVRVVDAACTWHAEPTDSPTDSKFSYTTNPYTVTAMYSGLTTTAFVSVANEGGCYDGKAYSAPTGFQGN